MKKQIKVRINWKKKYESSGKELESCNELRTEEHKNYNKNYKDMSSTKNFWIGVFAVALVIVTILFVFSQNESRQKDTRILLLGSANNYVVDSLRECRADLEIMTNLYNEEYYEVITAEKDNNGLFSDCCYPSDCVEAINNPVDCKCEYMLMCTESTIWG